jgi:hypothetical protein
MEDVMIVKIAFSALIIVACLTSAGFSQECAETRIGWGSDVTDLVVSGEFVVFNDGELLLIADLQNPAAPSILGTLQLDGWVVDLAVEDDLVCVVVDGTTLQVIDISNPLQPSLLSALHVGENLLKVVITGSHAVFGDGEPSA